MYSNMCVKIAVCLTLVACIHSHVIEHHEVPLSPEGMIFEINVKNKVDGQLVSSMIIDINTKDNKVLMSMGEPTIIVPVDVEGSTTEFVPSNGIRHNIRVSACPVGYVRRGGFCFPDDDY